MTADLEAPIGGWTEVLGEHATNPPTPRSTGNQLIYYVPCPNEKNHKIAKIGEHDSIVCSQCNGAGKIENTVTFSSCEARIKAQFEMWVRSNTKRMIAKAREFGDTEEVTLLQSVYAEDIAAGKYNWNGEHCQRAITSSSGFIYLTYLLISRCNPKATEKEVEELCKSYVRDVSECVKWALGNE